MYKIHTYLLISCVYIIFKAKRYNSGLIIYFGHGEYIYLMSFLILPTNLFTPYNARVQHNQT